MARNMMLRFASVLLILSGTAAGAGVPDRGKDDAAIMQTLEQQRAAWNGHDAHAFAMAYTGDADFTNVLGRHEHGRDKIEAFHTIIFSTVFKDSHLTRKLRSIRYLTPDLAMVDVDWSMTGAKLRDGTGLPERTGLANLIMSRQPDARWLILDMHNAEIDASPYKPH